MPEREYGQVKRVAEIKGAAQNGLLAQKVEPQMISATRWRRKKFVEISGAKAEDYLKKPTPDAKQTVKERW